MRRIILIAILLMLVTGRLTAFVAGGKNQDTTGSGTTSTGTDSRGTDSQPRTGR